MRLVQEDRTKAKTQGEFLAIWTNFQARRVFERRLIVSERCYFRCWQATTRLVRAWLTAIVYMLFLL